MNIESILFKSKQLTSQMIGVYELSLSGFSYSDLAEMIGVATNLCSSLHNDIQNNIEAVKIKSTTPTALKNKMHGVKPQNSFNARLKMALVRTKTTQASLAWAINVSQGTISQIVTGKVKEAGVVRTTAIAEALGISANWLLYGEGDMHDKQSENFESHAARLDFSNTK